eukprot:TRINITY_DN11384_c1_g1_i1.p1 TRINITY_DN11384_c1_g1~~TRINITY_DN11384_c1_g1_i1.p1  ORF type:complete len:179 (-),score=35.97 TRINITY_DN11384_c1_g1_i1:74-610(-)
MPAANTGPPSFWPSQNQVDPGGMALGNTSKIQYPDAVFSNSISTQTREFLRACWTDADEVRRMLDDGMDVQQFNTNGFSGLHMAASKLKVDIAKLLLERGHSVDVVEINGLTPLDYCIDSGFTVDNENGLAMKDNKAYHAMVALLESYGGLCREERCWLQAANQEKFAPNLPDMSAVA